MQRRPPRTHRLRSGPSRAGALRSTPGCALVAVTIALCVASPAAAEPASTPLLPPVPLPAAFTVGDAERVLQPPPGPRSVGATSAGRLLHGRAIRPRRAAGWAFMPHIPARNTTWGTRGMQDLLDHLGARVHGCRKGAELRVGNISLRGGGPSPWHRSHQAGRDVDLAPMLLGPDGKAAPTDDFVRLDRYGRARDGSGRRLDVRCTLRLVVALTEDDAPPVQWAFFARWLRKLLLAEAEREKLPAEVVARVADVLRQPSDSAPHDDHLHVRLFCSEAARRHGCLDRGPERSWAPRDEAGFVAHVQNVGRIAAAAPQPGLRLRATRLLGALRTPHAAGPLGGRLLDADAAVRSAALAGLVALGDEAAVQELLQGLGRTEDDVLALRLFDAARKLRVVAVVAAAQGLLIDPDRVVQPVVGRKVGEKLALAATAVLGEAGDRAAVPALLEALGRKGQAVRQAAHRALLRLTNQRVTGDPGAASGADKVRAAWRAFWQRARQQPEQAWLASGFRAHGVRVRSKTTLSRADVPRLIAAMRHRNPDVAANAERALELLSGRRMTQRSSSARARAWRRWYRATSR
ncbi:MAG: penicillin-insensitive murein endopeptidase [Deltaproteobacteria bacterium]|nr:penicillin-insensitive murein endopeptidase [Deltaproteobacteria bacterium]